MNINDTKLEALRTEREACIARIEQIDRVLEAVHVLVAEDIIPQSGKVVAIAKQVSHKRLKRPGKVLARNNSVWAAIEKSGNRVFTVPSVSRKTKLDKRRTKRAIDHFIDKGKVIISTQGYKSRATTYKLVRS